ncbi:MAG: FHA domain-containing protein, partial [Acidobacteria bacterium]|nr:FHA domain-containing protein [Acidobacteriota bacterium]
MPDLLVNYPDRASDTFPLGRLRITIGRSARNDVCIPDPFASRVHAEVRREGDAYILQDLGSANGTLYNGERVETALTLTPGGRVQIGETEIVFRDQDASASATMIADPFASAMPEATIALNSDQRSTSGLLEAIEDARTQGSAEQLRPTAVGTIISSTRASANAVQQSDLLALISKVSVTLLSPATLDETLRQVVALVFEAVPAERCLIMLRDKDAELKIRVAQLRNSRDETGEVRVSR